MALDTRTRCKMVTVLTQSTLQDLVELEAIERDSDDSQTELASLITLELERRRRLSREALERIWQEPLGAIIFETSIPSLDGVQVLEGGVDFRKTAPQPGDE
jgi:hypothetical protein